MAPDLDRPVTTGSLTELLLTTRLQLITPKTAVIALERHDDDLADFAEHTALELSFPPTNGKKMRSRPHTAHGRPRTYCAELWRQLVDP